tara:strand:+ start:55 stop:423 length:369 start_codon:yes stop_codon:yes gene_type:complete
MAQSKIKIFNCTKTLLKNYKDGTVEKTCRNFIDTVDVKKTVSLEYENVKPDMHKIIDVYGLEVEKNNKTTEQIAVRTKMNIIKIIRSSYSRSYINQDKLKDKYPEVYQDVVEDRIILTINVN